MRFALHRPSLAEQAVEVLRAALCDGLWVERIPGECELSKQFSISRPTLRAALEQLRLEGLAEKLAGSAAGDRPA